MNILWRNTLRQYKYSFSIIISPINCNTHQWFGSATIIPLLFAEWRFSISSFTQPSFIEILLQVKLSLLLHSFTASIIHSFAPISLDSQVFVLFCGLFSNSIYHCSFCCSKYPRYGSLKPLDGLLCMLSTIPSRIALYFQASQNVSIRLLLCWRQLDHFSKKNQLLLFIC